MYDREVHDVLHEHLGIEFREEQPVKSSPPPSDPPLVRKGELEFRALPPELEAQVWDYHADPVHLSLEDLDQLGLIATEERAGLGTSAVAPWRLGFHERRRDHQAPRLDEASSARALHTGGLAWLPVVEGLDVYVISYHASPVRLGATQLARLGLRYRHDRGAA
jgi:hypothetical protein